MSIRRVLARRSAVCQNRSISASQSAQALSAAWTCSFWNSQRCHTEFVDWSGARQLCSAWRSQAAPIPTGRLRRPPALPKARLRPRRHRRGALRQPPTPVVTRPRQRRVQPLMPRPAPPTRIPLRGTQKALQRRAAPSGLLSQSRRSNQPRTVSQRRQPVRQSTSSHCLWPISTRGRTGSISRWRICWPGVVKQSCG